MKNYLVGGAVRDELLGLPVKDRDWVVVGSTSDEMIDAGYRPVGKDFPVFLHPETHEEYALARTERKSGPGYRGFVVHAEPSVSLEDDLSRRDLTINAIAKADDGTVVDPFGGCADIESRIVRHVSDAFTEDPVRVLRAARFMARFAHLGFTVAPETMALMRDMTTSGEVAHLVPERVWQELENALLTVTPRAFIETLRETGALKVVLPELDVLFGVPQPPVHHPEIDTGEHSLLVLEQVMLLESSVEARIAALLHDLGKGTTPRKEWPSHHGHEERGAPLVEAVAERLRLPRHVRDLAVLSARYHGKAHDIARLRPATIAGLFDSLDVMRKPERFDRFVNVCEADSRGRTGFENRPYPQAARLRSLADAYRAVDAGAIARATADRTQIPEEIRLARIAAIKAARKTGR